MFRRLMLNIHLYLGIILSVMILMLSVTGFYLNHQHDWFHKQNIVYMNPEYENQVPERGSKLTMTEAMEKGTESGLYAIKDVKRVNHANHGLGTFFYLHLKDELGTIVVVDEYGEVFKAYTDSAVKKWMYDLHIGIVNNVNFILANDFTALGIVILTITGIILSVRVLRARRKKSVRRRN